MVTSSLSIFTSSCELLCSKNSSENGGQKTSPVNADSSVKGYLGAWLGQIIDKFSKEPNGECRSSVTKEEHEASCQLQVLFTNPVGNFAEKDGDGCHRH